MARLLIAGLLGAAAITPLLAQPAPVARVAPMIRVAPVAPMAPMAPHAMMPTTRAEAQAHVTQMFAMHDSNHDGFLTAEELKPGAGQRMIMRHDMRGPDGGMRGAGGAMAMRDPNVAFDRIDANHDGTISRSEFAAGRQVRIEKRIVMNAPGAPGQPQPMRMMHGGGMMGATPCSSAPTPTATAASR